MTQEEKWQARYDEVKAFIEANHRNPSKYYDEETLMVHFLKRGRKLMNAAAMKPERIKAFKELLALSERCKHKNQWHRAAIVSQRTGQEVMKHIERKNEIAPCQGYRGCADMEAVEYKYPRQRPVKYVLRITLTGSSPRVWREIAVPSTIKLTSLAHVIILAIGWEESHLSMFKKWRKE